MTWIGLVIFAVAPSTSRASYQEDNMKLKVCHELRINRRDMPIEDCFNGQFKFKSRGDLTDFHWRLNRRAPVCTGTIYEDAGSIHLDDGCDR